LHQTEAVEEQDAIESNRGAASTLLVAS